MLVQYDNLQKLVVQHKKFINARFDMNMNQLRIFVYMLLQIKKDDTEFKRIRIPCQLLHGARKKIHYEEIKEAASNLNSKAIEILSVTKNGRKKWEKINLMGYCSYTENEGFIVASFNTEAKPFLLNLSENFKGVEYERWCNVSSVYSYRFFWLLVQFEDSGYFEVSVTDLKEMLYLESKYGLYHDFKRKVLLPVQKDLKLNNFNFTFKEDKCGTRKVQKLKFYFSKKIKGGKQENIKRIASNGNKKQTSIDFRQANHDPEIDQVSKWMLGLGLSIAEIQYYKSHIDAKELKKSVYGLQNKWLGSGKTLLEIHKISKECLDDLILNLSN